MAIIVIGGHSRSVGKTSVVAGLISALPEFDWTAVKITQYGHGVCSANGEPCDCATADHSWAISEERDRSGESDTSRFLVAGAAQALWVRTEQGRLAEAMPALRPASGRRAQRDHRVQQRLEVSAPGPVPDRARSLRPQISRIPPANSWTAPSAVILHEAPDGPAWQSVSLKPVADRPFSASPRRPTSPQRLRLRPLPALWHECPKNRNQVFEARSLAARS